MQGQRVGKVRNRDGKEERKERKGGRMWMSGEREGRERREGRS